jgi:VCBS repeat-containing protein
MNCWHVNRLGSYLIAATGGLLLTAMLPARSQTIYSIDNGHVRFGFNNTLGTETTPNMAEDAWVGNVFTAIYTGTRLDSISFATPILSAPYTGSLNATTLPSPFVTAALYTGSPGHNLTLVPGSVNTIGLNSVAGDVVTVPFASSQAVLPGQVFTAVLLIRNVPATTAPFLIDSSGVSVSSYYDIGSPVGSVNSYNLASPNNPTLNAVTYPGQPAGSTNAVPGATMLRVNAGTVPILTNDAFATNEDTALSVAAPGLLSNDTDTDGDSLTALLASGPAHGTVSVNPNGGFTYTPSPNFNGVDTFTYRASDGHVLSEPATVEIAVAPVNDAPIAQPQSVATDKNVPLTVVLGATDVDGDALIYSVVSPPSHGTLSGSSGSLVYTPGSGYTGPDSFTFQATDGFLTSNVALVGIDVRPVDKLPVAKNDSARSIDGESVTIAVLSNDSDPDGDVLTVTSVTAPANGTAELKPDNTISYSPLPGFIGTDTFNYTISDGRGGTATALVQVVSSLNRAPKASNDTATTTKGTAVIVDVLANDSDPDGDAISVVDYRQPSTGGSVSLGSNGTLVFAPATGFKGKARFMYTISDTRGATSTATVTITVQ